MAVPQLLLETLQDLSGHGFIEFKWWLVKGVDFKSIPLSLLGDPDRMGTVGKMMDYYGEEMAVNIAVNVVMKIGRDDAAKKLKNRYAAGGDTAAASTSAAAPPAAPVAPPAAPAAPPAAPVAPPAAPASMTAQDQSNIIAPNVTGSTIRTLNINIYKYS